MSQRFTPVVKGSEQDELVIVRRRPGYRQRRAIQVLLVLVILAGGGFVAGGYQTAIMLTDVTMNRDQLIKDLAVSETARNDAMQKIAVLETGGEVDRQAAQTIQANVRQLNDEIAELRKEVAFYRGIMAPSDEDRGLRVSKIALTPIGGEGQVDYSVMLTQNRDNSTYISGIAAVNVVGKRNGEDAVIPLRDLDAQVAELGIRFRFRYFQELRGRLLLPEDFTAEKLQVVLKSTGKRQQKVEETQDWPRQEGSDV